MSESRTCPECGEAVAGGRLSCPACGALLATVRGRAAPVPAAGVRIDEPPVDAGSVPAEGAAVDPAEEVPSTLASKPAALPPAALPPAALPPAAAPALATPSVAGSAAAGGNRRSATGRSALPPALPRPSGPPAVDPGASGTWWGAGPPASAADPPVSSTFRSVPEVGSTPVAGASATPRRDRNGPTTPIPAAGERPPRPSAVDLPFLLPPGLGPRLVVIGAIAGAVAVLLPWAAGPTGVVIGGDIGLSYFAQWGLASPGNLLPLAATVLVLALGLMPGRVPEWLAYGVLPLADGGVLFGIAWTYLTSKYTVGIGIDVLALAAAMLGAGAIVVLRHAEERPNVT